MAMPASDLHPTLQNGAKGAQVEHLQDLLNRGGALLGVDGDFGNGTEGAVKEAQQTAGLPATGVVDDATWAWLEQQPEPSPVIPTEAVTFIVREEVGSRKFYEQRVAMPTFPGGQSGVTIGLGCDLRFQTPQEFEDDWGGELSAADMAALRPFLGKQGDAQAVAGLTNVRVPFPAAWRVFVKRHLPRTVDQTSGSFGDLDALPPLCRGALVSLVYNRGPSVNGDKRREMKAIQQHIEDKRLDLVPAEFESMKRLWPNARGLRDRRDREADMWRRGLQAVV